MGFGTQPKVTEFGPNRLVDDPQEVGDGFSPNHAVPMRVLQAERQRAEDDARQMAEAETASIGETGHFRARTMIHRISQEVENSALSSLQIDEAQLK